MLRYTGIGRANVGLEVAVKHANLDSLAVEGLGVCHGSTGSPSALSEEDSKGGVTVLEGSKVLARGTRSCT